MLLGLVQFQLKSKCKSVIKLWCTTQQALQGLAATNHKKHRKVKLRGQLALIMTATIRLDAHVERR